MSGEVESSLDHMDVQAKPTLSDEMAAIGGLVKLPGKEEPEEVAAAGGQKVEASPRLAEIGDSPRSAGIGGAEPEEEPEGEPSSPSVSPPPSPAAPARAAAAAEVIVVTADNAEEDEWAFHGPTASSPAFVAAADVIFVAADHEQEDGWAFHGLTAGNSVAAIADPHAKLLVYTAAVVQDSDAPVATQSQRESDLTSRFQPTVPSALAPVATQSQRENDLASRMQPTVPPPPPPCFAIGSNHCIGNMSVAVDTRPCLVELAAASASSSARSSDPLDCFGESGDVEECAPAGEENERLLPGLFLLGSSRSGSSRTADDSSSRCAADNMGDSVAATPRKDVGCTPQTLACFLSPMSSCARSPAKPTGPLAPAPSPVQPPPVPASDANPWYSSPMHEAKESLTGRRSVEVSTSAPSAASNQPIAAGRADDNTWFRAARRTLLPLSGPLLGRLPSLDQFSFTDSACCSVQCARSTVEAAAASSIPATEARLLTVPRPSMRGLRTTSGEVAPISSPGRGRCEVPVSPLMVRSMTPPVLPGSEVVGNVLRRRSASMPALPSQAAALPSRAPSGDIAVDAAELLLGREINPFGEDGS